MIDSYLLLDWSFSPLIALYIACSDTEKTDGAVFVFNPWTYTLNVVFNSLPIPDIHTSHKYARALMSDRKDSIDKILKHVKNEFDIEIDEDSLKKPFPFLSSFNNPRIIHQKGCFTIHGLDTNDFETQLKDIEDIYLAKIIVRNPATIKKELSFLFINEFSVYPDFQGMAKQLKEDRSLYKVYF